MSTFNSQKGKLFKTATSGTSRKSDGQPPTSLRSNTWLGSPGPSAFRVISSPQFLHGARRWMLWERRDWPLLVLGHATPMLTTFYKPSLSEWGFRIKVYTSRWIKLRYKICIRLHTTDFASEEIILGFSCQDRFFRLLGLCIGGFDGENTYEAESSRSLPGKVQDRERAALLFFK